MLKEKTIGQELAQARTAPRLAADHKTSRKARYRNICDKCPGSGRLCRPIVWHALTDEHGE